MKIETNQSKESSHPLSTTATAEATVMAGIKEGGEELTETKPSLPFPCGADMVVFITMCLIGLPVEVQVKDGSRFYGVVHTAYFKDDHGVFLKNAKKIGKGKRQTNIAIGETVDILLIHFDDLVQVISKDFTPPVKEIFDKCPGTESITEDVYLQAYSRVSEIEENELHLSASRYLSQNGNVESLSDSNNYGGPAINVEKNSGVSAGKALEEEPKVEDVGKKCICSAEDSKQSGQPTYILRGRQIKCVVEGENHDPTEEKAQEIQLLSPSSKANGVRDNSPTSPSARGTPDSSTLTTVSSSEAEVSSLSTSNSSASDSRASSNASRSTSPDTPVPAKKTIASISIKESNLNPSAKLFTPSFARFQPASSATPAIVSPEYMLNNFPVMTVAGQQLGTEICSFPRHSPAQSKLVMCNNLVAGQNDVGAQYVQPVPGHANMRHQPVRFNGQYHPVQVGSPCVNPLPETVMVSRLGQLMYMNPVPQDAIQGMPVISQEHPHSLFTPYQANLPKFQGHTMQLPMNPTIVTGGNPAVLMPSFSQPLVSGRTFVVPNGTGYFNCKYQ